MPLENASYISDLVPSNPAASDGMNNSDDHMRMIKAALKNTFPGITGAFTRTLFPDGTAAAPSYSFAAEATLGFYRSAAGIMSFTGILRGNGTVAAGFISDFGGANAPAGWLVCDGQAVSRTTYADLFAAIGTTWGAGDGSTTFNVPPLIARFRRHRDNSTLAGAVGNQQNPVNLTHTHAVTGTSDNASADHTHPFSGTTGAMDRNASHTHTVNTVSLAGANNNGGGGGGAFSAMSSSTATITTTNTDHYHPFSGTTGSMSAQHAHTFSTTTAAAGDANEARPYSATVLTCIKT